MWKLLLSFYSGTLIALGTLVAIACLACSWYINRLQADLAHAVRKDAAGMAAAVDLQVQLRHLRVHALVLAADGTDPRRETVRSDLGRVDGAIRAIHQAASTLEDARLADKIGKDYAEFRATLHLDHLPLQGPMSELARWSDQHHMGELIDTCRELADVQRGRMQDNLERSEAQTSWAGRMLLGLGVGGVLAGLMSGYVTARTLNRRVAQLFFRVQAVQAHLDQDVGALTVQGLMDFAGAPPLDRHPQDLNAVVADAVKVAQGRAEMKSVAVRFDLSAGPLRASVDHDRFLSLLTNLLFNAIDATPAGGDVQVSTAYDPNGMIQVVVADSGPGISEAVAGNLFTPFTTDMPTGTGLGLTVARRIAQEHGGALTAAKRPEGGACFRLTVPVAER